jgi:hypothetical protein
MSPYTVNRCPQCGANLPAESETLTCPYCRTVLRSETPAISIPGEIMAVVMPSSHHLAALVENISSFLSDPEDGNYLIASIGDCYVQLLYQKGVGSVLCEAVSNQFLAKNRQIGRDQEAVLLQMGFRQARPDSNYARYFDLSQPGKIEEFAGLVELIFAEVYGCSSLVKIDFELG